MSKRYLPLFVLGLIALIGMLQFSCRKIDLTASAHDKDFSKQFFETNSTNPKILQIIASLKNENERSGFVSKLPKNCGLPVWDKLVLQNKNLAAREAEDSTESIIIPLTNTNEDLSSIIIVQLVDGSYIINCYKTNDYLYWSTHGTAIDTLQATNDLSLFFYMERRTFGTTQFYHIPAGFFPKITTLDSDGNKTITISQDTTGSTNNLAPIQWICIDYLCPVCFGQDPNCPLGGQWTICTPIGGGAGGGGGSGGGGSGGGSGGGGSGGGGTGGSGGGTGGGGTGGGTGGGGGGECPFGKAWYAEFLPPVDPCGPDDPPGNPPYNPHDANRIEIDTSITNNFPCLDTLLQNLPNANQAAQELLHNAFDVNIYSNLTFQIDWSLNGTSLTNAYTTPGGGYSYAGIFRFFDTIKINPWLVQNASKEYLIGVIMHEAAHAYIRYRFNQWQLGFITAADFISEFPLFWPNYTNPLNATEIMEHQQMAFSYVASISDVVRTYFNPAASQALKNRLSNSIAWEGLREATVWKFPGLDTCRIVDDNVGARNTTAVFYIPARGVCPADTVRYDSLGLSLPCH